ncbi:class I SAM-dependent methyltransferase [Candidatus Bathyarchaeota archaeon]|nr:class I SAM-dependent methyltransferase [Candidatus Bathyarchaeota archaeon]
MPRLRLRSTSGPPQLGWNTHVITGHQRLTFLKEHYIPGRILDVGCGEGGFAIAMSRYSNNYVWAIDIQNSPPMTKAPFIHFEAMSVYDIPKSYGFFNTIILMEIVEHIEEPEKAIELLYSHLKTSGVLLISTPWVDTYDFEEDHIWRFDPESFEELLKGYEYSTWIDDIFIYGKIVKRDEENGTTFIDKA